MLKSLQFFENKENKISKDTNEKDFEDMREVVEDDSSIQVE